MGINLISRYNHNIVCLFHTFMYTCEKRINRKAYTFYNTYIHFASSNKC